MALAGITCVGEFHYLHHQRGGVPYADPNVMGQALIEAAAQAGVRLTLLDTCYVAGGFDQPLAGPQLRFGDGDAGQWAARADTLSGPADRVRVGAAIHSVLRAVPRDDRGAVAQWRRHAAFLHFHLCRLRRRERCLPGSARRHPNLRLRLPTTVLEAITRRWPRVWTHHRR